MADIESRLDAPIERMVKDMKVQTKLIGEIVLYSGAEMKSGNGVIKDDSEIEHTCGSSFDHVSDEIDKILLDILETNREARSISTNSEKTETIVRPSGVQHIVDANVEVEEYSKIERESCMKSNQDKLPINRVVSNDVGPINANKIATSSRLDTVSMKQVASNDVMPVKRFVHTDVPIKAKTKAMTSNQDKLPIKRVATNDCMPINAKKMATSINVDEIIVINNSSIDISGHNTVKATVVPCTSKALELPIADKNAPTIEGISRTDIAEENAGMKKNCLEEDLKVAVLDKSNEKGIMSKEKAAKFKAHFLSVLDAVNQWDTLQFRYSKFVNNYYLVSCNNVKTKEWLAAQVLSWTPWIGAKFELVAQRQLPKVKRFKFSVDGNATADIILSRLAKQNKTLNTKEWVVRVCVKRKELFDKQTVPGINLVVDMDEASADEIILHLDRRPFYALTRVVFIETAVFAVGSDVSLIP